MVKKCCVLHEKVIDVFNEKYYITTIEKLSFHIAHVKIICSMKFGNNINYCFHVNAPKTKLKNMMQKNLAKKPVYKYRVNIGAEINNYQRKVLLLNILQVQLILVTTKKNMNDIHI